MIVYKIYNTINGKCYIGQTNNIHRRIQRHIRESKTRNTPLYRSIRKYGYNVFNVEILCYCDFKEELDDMEFHYIRQYRSREYENGYNLTDGGDGTIGYLITEDHRKNISKSLKNRVFTEDHRKNISKSKKDRYVIENHPNYGKTLSDETRKKISESHKGKLISDETRKKISYWNNNVKDRVKYRIVGPDGIITETSFVDRFCKEFGLVYSCMMKVCRGERKHHKGYTIFRI